MNKQVRKKPRTGIFKTIRRSLTSSASVPGHASPSASPTPSPPAPVGGGSPPPLSYLPSAGPTPGGTPPLPSSKSLFIALLKKLQGQLNIGQEIIDTTVQLFDSQQIDLADNQIIALLGAWEQVVTTFSKDPIGTISLSRPGGTIEAIISFDAIHSDLENLYNQLTINVKRTTEDSLDSFLSSLY
jgi:hypothetical protein